MDEAEDAIQNAREEERSVFDAYNKALREKHEAYVAWLSMGVVTEGKNSSETATVTLRSEISANVRSALERYRASISSWNDDLAVAVDLASDLPVIDPLDEEFGVDSRVALIASPSGPEGGRAYMGASLDGTQFVFLDTESETRAFGQALTGLIEDVVAELVEEE
ncbi:hypothetical protein SAMN06298212_10849 [Ruaniaceae bacterium KH17]|nr:hypothetical protein SAMN06298212_10849 [Ruaniaceae bacterium KH17]